MRLLISGSLVYDHIMNFPDSFRNHILPDQVHILNVSFIVDKLEKSWGGTAGNIAFTAKLLGGEPVIVSAVGRDGKEYLEHVASRAISTERIITDETQLTASAYITTDADDNQITAFYAGPLRRAKEVSFTDAGNAGDIAIVAPTDKETMRSHLFEAASAGMRAVFDPGQQMTAFSGVELKQMLERSEFVIGNDYEMKLIEDRTGWGAKEILTYAKVMVTTLGGEGSIIVTSGGEEVRVKSCPPQSFDDPTGAGDAYRAGFFVGVLRGFDWKACGQMGSVAASYAIETYGTQEHDFTKESFSDRYRKTYREDVHL